MGRFPTFERNPIKMKYLFHSTVALLILCFALASARADDKTVTLEGVTFTHKSTTVNGVTLHYVIGGKGEPIILFHGYPETWYDWRKIMPALSRQYTVIAPDMRGLGDSSRPADGDYTKKSVADDIYQLVQRLGYKQVYLVAQDMGGPVAIAYAAAHPDTVRKMVIVESSIPGYGLEEAMDTAHGGSWHFGLFADTETALLLTKGREREFFTQWAFRGKYVVDKTVFTEADIKEYVGHYAAPGGMAAGFGYYHAFAQDAKDNAILFAQTKLPFPILAVGADHSFGDATLKSVQSIGTNVRGVIMKDCGHFVNEEKPAELTGLITVSFAQP